MTAVSRPRTVLIACVPIAGRPQMAAALPNQLAEPGRACAISAGTQPADHVHPVVAEVMREAGLDLGGVRPQLLTPELTASVDLLITMGCGEACPAVPGLRREDWPLPDPKGQPIERVREIRDEIRERVQRLLASL